MKLKFVFASVVTLALGSPAAWSAAIYDVRIDTSALIGHIAGPFALEAQFNDGRGTGDANNTAMLSLFSFGSGAGTGSAILTGGVTGGLGSSVTMTDSSFFNEFIQTFNPGSMFSFRLSLTTNVDAGGTPDEFSVAILDRSGVEIPTLNVANALLVIDIDSATPSVLTFATNATQGPNAGGPPISIAAPKVTPVSAAPEPKPIFLMVICLMSMLIWRRWGAVRKAPIIGFKKK